jgi:hypothetical protein
MSTCPVVVEVGGLQSLPLKIGGINPTKAQRDKKVPRVRRPAWGRDDEPLATRVEDPANSGNLESSGIHNDRVYDFSCH